MKNKIFLGLQIISLVLLSSCVGHVQHHNMDLVTDIRSQQIMNLRRVGVDDIDFFRQDERLMRSGFLDNRGEEYGYYRISYQTTELGTWHPPTDWLVFLNYLTLMTGSFVGLPIEGTRFTLNARLEIFDSNGRLIKRYDKSDSFYQVSGLYYGGDSSVTRRAARIYSEMFYDLFQMANFQSGEINETLLAAGPIINENDLQARQRIAQQTTFPRVASSRRPPTGGSFVASPPGSPITPVPSSPAMASSAQTLQMGTFSGSGASFTLSISATGTVTAIEGGRAIAFGTHRISGNNIVFDFHTGTPAFTSRTYIYTITSGTSFSGMGETWVRTGF